MSSPLLPDINTPRPKPPSAERSTSDEGALTERGHFTPRARPPGIEKFTVEEGTLTERVGWHHFARHQLPFQQAGAEVSMQCGGSYLQSARAKQARKNQAQGQEHRKRQAQGAQTSQADFVEAEFYERIDSEVQLKHLQEQNQELMQQLAIIGGLKKKISGDKSRTPRGTKRETMPVGNKEWEQLQYRVKLAEREKQVAQAEAKALRKQVNWYHNKMHMATIRENHHFAATRITMLIIRFASNQLSWALRSWSDYVNSGQEQMVRLSFETQLPRAMRDALKRALAALQWASVSFMFETWYHHHHVMEAVRNGTLETNPSTEVLQSVLQHFFTELQSTPDLSALLSKVCDLGRHLILSQHAAVHISTQNGLEPMHKLFSNASGQRVIHGMGLSINPYTAHPLPPTTPAGSHSAARKSQFNPSGLLNKLTPPKAAVEALSALALKNDNMVILGDMPELADQWPDLAGLCVIPVHAGVKKPGSDHPNTPSMSQKADAENDATETSPAVRSRRGGQQQTVTIKPPVAMMVFANWNRPFDETRMNLLQQLTRMAEPALGRAEAFTKHVLQLQQLRSVVGPLDEKEEEGTQGETDADESTLERVWSNLSERQAASLVLVRAMLKPMCAEKGTVVFIDNNTEELLYQAPKEGSTEVRMPFTRDCVVGCCIMNGELISISAENNNDADNAALKEMNELFDEPIRSMVCAPVIANDGTVLGAVLVVNRVGASKFSSDDQLALASFAKAHCAKAISQADRDSRLEATHVRMYDHENMAKTLAKEASLENFALMQCERLATLLQCEQIQLFIKERETNDFMRFRLTKSGEPDISLIPVTTGIVVDCFQKQQVEHILEPLSDPRYGANDGPGRSQPIRNMLVVPLQAGDDENVVGVMQAVNKLCDEGSVETFSLLDQAQLVVSAGHAAAAMQGFKLLERLSVTETQLLNLQELTISTTRTHSTGGDELKLLLGLLARMVDAKLASLYLVARGGHPILELKATYHGKTKPLVGHVRKARASMVTQPARTVDDDYMELTSPVQMNQGIMGEVAITGQSVHTNFIDIGGEQHDPSQLFDKAVDAPEEMHVQTLVSVPLVVADGPVLGVCQFVNKCNKTVFSRADVLTLNAAAALVGMAIVNADLQGQVSQVELRFSSLQDLVRKALTPPRTSHEDKIDHVLTHCRRVLCADVLLLYKSNPRDNTFRNVAMDASLLATGYWSRGYSIDMVQGTAVFGQGIVGLCAISGEMVKTTLECRSDDALDVMDSQGRFDKSIDAPANYPVRSLLCMPIKDPATGTLIGVIEALDKNDSMLPDPVEFDAEDESLLSVMAVMMAEDLSHTLYADLCDRKSTFIERPPSPSDAELIAARNARKRRSSNHGVKEVEVDATIITGEDYVSPSPTAGL